MDSCNTLHKFYVRQSNSEVKLSAYLTMAHPGFVIEQYVYHFLSQWRVGLQPSLELHAKSNGEIAISLNISTSLPLNHDEDERRSPPSRSSGRGSRIRRRARRKAAESTKETTEGSTQSHVEAEQDQCTSIESLPIEPPTDSTEPMSAVCHINLPPTSNLFCVTQESQQQTDEDRMLTLSKNTIEERAVVQCSLCQDQAVSFSRRADFLRHVCVDHFGEEHLVDFPEFLPNDVFQQAMTLSI